MGTDLDAIMNDPIGQPMAAVCFAAPVRATPQMTLTRSQILLNSFGTKWALVIWAFVILAQ